MQEVLQKLLPKLVGPFIFRESYITLIILVRWLCLNALAYEPLEIAEFTRTVSEANLAAAKTHVHLARAKNAPR